MSMQVQGAGGSARHAGNLVQRSSGPAGPGVASLGDRNQSLADPNTRLDHGAVQYL
jgi:hypothetical protein